MEFNLKQIAEQIYQWMNQGKFFSYKKSDFIKINKESVEAVIYTENHSYHISATSDYLGCVASSRKPLAGETWTRGNDLADGPFNKDTWNDILIDILTYEMVEIKKSINAPSSKKKLE